MMLSRETLEGLHITGKNAMPTHAIHYNCTSYAFYSTIYNTVYGHSVRSLDEGRVPYLLSEKFTQDPIENYFGQQRSRGGWCQNPTVQACISSAQSLRKGNPLIIYMMQGGSCIYPHVLSIFSFNLVRTRRS